MNGLMKIEIPAEFAVKIADKHGFKPFDCECILIYEKQVNTHQSGDEPVELAESKRFYLVVQPK